MKQLLVLFFLISWQTGYCQTYAVVADHLVDVNQGKLLDNPVVIVEGGKITGVNYTGTIPDSAVVINLKGYTVLPGLMDVHTHILADGRDYDKDLYGNSPVFRALRAAGYLSRALQNGITTIRDVCSEGAMFADVDLAHAVDSGFIAGPRIIPSGRGIAATGMYEPWPGSQNWSVDLPYGTQFATGPQECIKAVREQVTHGVRWVKLFADWGKPTFNYDEIKAVVDEAQKYHINVAAHATTSEGIGMAIRAGAKSIEHGDAFNDTLIQLALAHNVYWCPTISVFEYFNMPIDSNYKYLHKAYQQGLKIVMGTDIGSYPWQNNEAKELWYYVTKAGFTPADAIKTATINAAALLGRQETLGRLAKGFAADIIAVKGNPLQDIALLQQVGFVMKAGKIYRPLK
jgi:imidazolonepropionase-like amidohydrolase